MIDFTRITRDSNGNPRYVCSFLHLLTKAESNAPIYDSMGRRISPTKYQIAVKRANKIGGRKYNTKSYGGGIVFQSYNIHETENAILQAVAEAEDEQLPYEFKKARDAWHNNTESR